MKDYEMNIIDQSNFTIEFLTELFTEADRFRTLSKNELVDFYKGQKIMTTLFLEPSTRTRFSFEFAMNSLGGKVMSATGSADLSITKGESIADTIKAISHYSDLIVIRSKEPSDTWGSEFSIPIINAGDGANFHPTQALIDLYTLYRSVSFMKGRDLSLTFNTIGVLEKIILIGIVGDLQYSRSIRSFVSLIKNISNSNNVHFVAYDNSCNRKNLKGIDDVINHLSYEDFKQKLHLMDILYLNRLQRERYKDLLIPINRFSLDPETISNLNKKAIVLNPGPKSHELPDSVMGDPRIKYWEQVENGKWLRMALIAKLLNK